MRRFLTNDVRLRQYKMHMFRRISACWSLTDSFMYIYMINCGMKIMSLVLRKPVLGVSDQVRHKPGCTATEDG